MGMGSKGSGSFDRGVEKKAVINILRIGHQVVTSMRALRQKLKNRLNARRRVLDGHSRCSSHFFCLHDLVDHHFLAIVGQLHEQLAATLGFEKPRRVEITSNIP